MFIVLMGPPGCGKGTQSAKLVELLAIPHLSTGDILRQMAQVESPLGQELAECLEQGKLVSDELIVRLVADRIQQADCKQGCLWDGVPRNVPQAQSLDQVLATSGCAVDVVVAMHVAEEELFNRLLRRAEQEGRSDDNKDTIRRRMDIYNQETAPVLEHYRHQGKLKSIDAVGTPAEVFARIKSVLDQIEE